MNLSTLFGTQGANWTVSSACSSGANAIGQATMLIKSGMQDIVIVGGAQELSWQSMISFDSLGVFSKNSDPSKASSPFDKSRVGLVPSGGSACLVLEELSFARARGAEIYGIVSGYGFSSDGDCHISTPTLEGPERAIKMALNNAGVTPDEIEYINAHATSTPVGDKVEAGVINKVFGSEVPVSSTKSITGHECWMAGASEVLYTTLMAKGGFIAANKNFHQQEDDCKPINVAKETIDKKINLAMSNSFGFGGTNSVLVLDYNECRH
jgi:3-oxoacyl-[acyl-carrier-protein] synthase-1